MKKKNIANLLEIFKIFKKGNIISHESIREETTLNSIILDETINYLIEKKYLEEIEDCREDFEKIEDGENIFFDNRKFKILEIDFK